MTATRLLVRAGGGSGLIQPCSNALSMMVFSMFLMVTAGEVIPSTQAPCNDRIDE